MEFGPLSVGRPVGCRMASKLDDRLLEGERVVFRARYGFVSTAVFIVTFSVILAGAYLIFGWLFGLDWRSNLIYVLTLDLCFIWLIWNRTVLVTDRRVIYPHGDWKRKVGEVPLKAIEQVVFHTGGFAGFVSMRCHGDENIVLRLLPKPQDLRDAIASQCGLPVPARTGPKILVSAALVNVFSCIGVLTAFIWSVLFAVDFFERVLPALSDAAFYGLLIVTPFVIFLSGVLGGILGQLLGLFCLRFILTPEQAKHFLRVDAMDPGSDWWARITRWCSVRSAGVLNRLYRRSMDPEQD